MSRVTCIVSDSRIWNKDQFIVDLVNADNPVQIDMLREGPCCHSIGLDALLDSIPGLIVDAIYTSNQIPSSKFKEIRTLFAELDFAKQKIPYTQLSTLKKRFAIFVGRSNWQRLALASFLWNQYKDSSVITYHYNNSDDYHLANFGLETLLQKNWDIRQSVYEFLEHLPLTVDQQTYPILWNKSAFDLDYSDIFCEVVCETFFTGNTFMMTEKTMRPIIQRRPFIVQGPKYFLENLKRLGFKTFNNWWDESYDLDDADAKFNSIKWTLNYIGQQSAGTINQWYQEMQPILEHNVDILRKLSNSQIIATEFKSN